MATCGVHSTETATLGGRIKTSASGGSLLGTGTSTFGVTCHDDILLKSETMVYIFYICHC